ncbi:MAG TPA: cytochrome ubiquinol oxidase subunit I [Caulobacteraceae bacterium]|jgi:cytochrome d ubiquinol oxidase subunit I
MSEAGLTTLISRIDFAWITTMHILYPPLTIGLSIILFLSEWRWNRTDDEKWYRLCRFFERLFIINFGAAVATGVTMEMAFGILFGRFSQAAGPLVGQLLGYETISAFMYEAGFLGLMVFGWGKINKRMHLFATFNVALASTISAWWILDANSWMQTPTGVVLKNGVFEVENWLAALLNPDSFVAFWHIEVASVELALCFVAAVSAWFLLKQRHVELFLKPLKIAVFSLLLIAPLQIFIGDSSGQLTAKHQPAALAAMEGHYRTRLPNGEPNTSWNVVAWPDADGHGNAWSIKIPHALSLLENHTWNSAVPGLDTIPAADRPPVVIPFYAFRAMSAVGTAVFLLALWGAWLAFRGRLSVAKVCANRWFLRAALLGVALPYLGIWTGWWTREVGRQPWVVYGLMRTADGVSHMSLTLAVSWLVGFMAFELMASGATFYFMTKVVRLGPDLDSPVVTDGPAHEARRLPRFAAMPDRPTPGGMAAFTQNHE